MHLRSRTEMVNPRTSSSACRNVDLSRSVLEADAHTSNPGVIARKTYNTRSRKKKGAEKEEKNNEKDGERIRVDEDCNVSEKSDNDNKDGSDSDECGKSGELSRNAQDKFSDDGNKAGKNSKKLEVAHDHPGKDGHEAGEDGKVSEEDGAKHFKDRKDGNELGNGESGENGKESRGDGMNGCDEARESDDEPEAEEITLAEWLRKRNMEVRKALARDVQRCVDDMVFMGGFELFCNEVLAEREFTTRKVSSENKDGLGYFFKMTKDEAWQLFSEEIGELLMDAIKILRWFEDFQRLHPGQQAKLIKKHAPVLCGFIASMQYNSEPFRYVVYKAERIIGPWIRRMLTAWGGKTFCLLCHALVTSMGNLMQFNLHSVELVLFCCYIVFSEIETAKQLTIRLKRILLERLSMQENQRAEIFFRVLKTCGKFRLFARLHSHVLRKYLNTKSEAIILNNFYLATFERYEEFGTEFKEDNNDDKNSNNADNGKCQDPESGGHGFPEEKQPECAAVKNNVDNSDGNDRQLVDKGDVNINQEEERPEHPEKIIADSGEIQDAGNGDNKIQKKRQPRRRAKKNSSNNDEHQIDAKRTHKKQRHRRKGKPKGRKPDKNGGSDEHQDVGYIARGIREEQQPEHGADMNVGDIEECKDPRNDIDRIRERKRYVSKLRKKNGNNDNKDDVQQEERNDADEEIQDERTAKKEAHKFLAGTNAESSNDPEKRSSETGIPDNNPRMRDGEGVRRCRSEETANTDGSEHPDENSNISTPETSRAPKVRDSVDDLSGTIGTPLGTGTLAGSTSEVGASTYRRFRIKLPIVSTSKIEDPMGDRSETVSDETSSRSRTEVGASVGNRTMEMNDSGPQIGSSTFHARAPKSNKPEIRIPTTSTPEIEALVEKEHKLGDSTANMAEIGTLTWNRPEILTSSSEPIIEDRVVNTPEPEEPADNGILIGNKTKVIISSGNEPAIGTTSSEAGALTSEDPEAGILSETENDVSISTAPGMQDPASNSPEIILATNTGPEFGIATDAKPQESVDQTVTQIGSTTEAEAPIAKKPEDQVVSRPDLGILAGGDLGLETLIHRNPEVGTSSNSRSEIEASTSSAPESGNSAVHGPETETTIRKKTGTEIFTSQRDETEAPINRKPESVSIGSFSIERLISTTPRSGSLILSTSKNKTSVNIEPNTKTTRTDATEQKSNDAVRNSNNSGFNAAPQMQSISMAPVQHGGAAQAAADATWFQNDAFWPSAFRPVLPRQEVPPVLPLPALPQLMQPFAPFAIYPPLPFAVNRDIQRIFPQGNGNPQQPPRWWMQQ